MTGQLVRERAAGARTQAKSGFRIDIQALRAVAVMGVVLFHLWPGLVPGGYVGVDVFFVVSGFLITAHLDREIQASGTVRLARFWARRVRRLLPAALTVLAVTALATFLLVPQSFWAQHFREIAASALYVENWTLAADAVDYLNAENAASSAQHYWSLSVEEQFYVIWPLLLLFAVGIARRVRRSPALALRVALIVVGVASLAASVVVTAVDPAPAYFVTYTRAWEFAAGGLLALSPLARREPSRGAATLLRGVGWLLVLGTTIGYSSDLPFPGWIALVPVLGTLAVIAAGPTPTSRFDARLVGAAPVQYLGTVSYSLYLWHWPLVVLAPFVVSWSEPWLGLVLLVLGVLLAHATQRWIENPVRFHPTLTHSTGRSVAFAAVGMAVVVALAGSGMIIAQRSADASVAQAEEIVSQGQACFGADATLGDPASCPNPELDGVLLPEPAGRLEDTSGAYSCYLSEPVDAPKVCTIGAEDPTARIALVGDSHAAMLIPALKPHLEKLGWAIDLYVSRGGMLAAPSGSDDMDEYRRTLISELRDGGYDLVLATARRSPEVTHGQDPSLPLIAEALRAVADSGAQVVALSDNPYLSESADACIAAAEDLTSAKSCEMTRDEALAFSDPLPAAVEAAGAGVHLVDLTTAYCDDDRCPLVVGNVVVYRDRHHITATFARTLGPFLAREIDRMLADPATAG
ncbi:acyltransferase family protein [Microbacterium sp.]|uniref:acyltransferase family protein n=1 Tax=Microbacterium sp. TaxID=51671 RepID=UPI00281237BD|nr:acyltransferase family protein [Microbacterium sp.]